MQDVNVVELHEIYYCHGIKINRDKHDFCTHFPDPINYYLFINGLWDNKKKK